MLHELMTGAALVHPTAEIEPGAVIGDGSRLWALVHVRTGARIGRDCTLGRNVFVDAGAGIGDRVKIQNNVSVYRGVTLHDEVFVGPSVVFTNDLRPRATSTDWTVVPTVVRTGASIGGGAVIVCGVEIGPHAMVAAGAVVTRDVPAHGLVLGNPARLRGWVCRCGNVITGTAQAPSQWTCAACLADPA